MSWSTIESDPGVFTQLLEACGTKGLQVEELVSLDDESLEAKRPIFGLILLFKYIGDGDGGDGGGEGGEGDVVREFPELWFAKQVIENACGTQALLHVVMNLGEAAAGVEGVEEGEALGMLRAFSGSLPPDARGEVLQSMDAIREAHNSFSRAEPFLAEKSAADGEGEAFHFSAFVPSGGRVVELDGLKRGPVDHGAVRDAQWDKTARDVIRRRFERYGPAELRFTLLAVTRDARLTARDALARGGGERWERALRDAQEQRRTWARENERRKHNWVPFLLRVFQEAARRDKLQEWTRRGKQRASAQLQAAIRRKKEAAEE